MKGGMGRRKGTRTYAWIPSGFSDSHDIIEKETGAVLHEDTPAFEEGAHGRVGPKGMDVRGECF